MHLCGIEVGDAAAFPARADQTGSLAGKRSRGRGAVGWFRVVASVTVLLLLVTGCRTFSARLVEDPGPAVARLQVGGTIEVEVDRLAQPLVQSREVYGMAVGVMTPDGQVRTYGYGSTGLPGEAERPRGDTIFQIGSVSKLFIAALLAVLVDEGALSYEDTVRSILPPEVRLNEDVGKVTLYELATNTGGLPRQPFCPSQLKDFIAYLCTGRNVYAYFTKPYLYRYLRRTHIKPKEKREYVYSNIGYGLLAHLIEVKTGRSFADLLEEKICRPLNLRDTTFVLSAEQRQRLAVGHAGGQPRFLRRGTPMEPWDMGEIMRASACLYSTVNDLMVFTQANLGGEQLRLERVLASTLRVQLSRPEEDVALGWLINYLGEDRLKITYKHGMVAGYHCYVGMNVEGRIAVVVLCNTFAWEDKIGHNLVLLLSRGLSSRSPSPAAAR